ncbi:MAG: Gfo/Idh/MocA family oxidoreductase [Microbacterium sp.]|nr:Gfo/Idh/MocA family oxidoreductase [Microbacterium sp.]
MTVKVGVLSLAHVHAASYVDILGRIADVEVRVADPDGEGLGAPDRGRAGIESLGATDAGSYDELFAWQPDAVIVTSENSRHRELVERAADVGADILCEKPLATERADAHAIRDAVSRSGVRFATAYPVRFATSFRQLVGIRDSGALGEIVAVRGENNGKLPSSRDWFTDPVLAGGGALFDHVVHVADLLDVLLDSPPVSVAAVTNGILHRDRADVETGGLVLVEYADGVIASIDCSWSLPDTAPRWGGVWLHVLATGGTADIDFFDAAVRGVDGATGSAVELSIGENVDEALLTAFLDMVRGDEHPPLPDLDAGLRSLSIVFAAQESARTGRRVAVAL